MIHTADHPERLREHTVPARQPHVADLVDALFRQKRNPANGRNYSYAEVSRALDGALKPSYIGKLHSGEMKHPGRDAILHLCCFFEVPAAYFFPELVNAASQERPAEALQRVLAALQLTAQQQALVESLVAALQAQVDTATPGASPHDEDVT